MKMKWRRKVINGILFLLGYFIGKLIVRKTTLGTGRCQMTLEEFLPHRLSFGSDGSLMIGVMTRHSQLATQASAIYSTWGRDSPAFVLFYIGHNSTQEALNNVDDRKTEADAGPTKEGKPLWPHRTEPIQLINGLPVVELRGVNDNGYPPRDKSFAMLSHMMHNFGTRFKWFLRSDDDVYIRVEKLIRFLQSLNSSLPWYIGQPGFGKVGERGHLGLKRGKPYCMGGPGAVFSSVTLRKLVPHLQDCAGEVVTPHEDTEVGRCVVKYLRISCTTNNKKMSGLFRHFKEDDKLNELSRLPSGCLTIHPVKEASLMYKFHVMNHIQQLQDLRRDEQQVLLDLKKVNWKLISIQPGLHRFGIVDLRRRDVDSFSTTKSSLEEETTYSVWNIWHAVSKLDLLRLADLLPPKIKEAFASRNFQTDVLLEDNPVWRFAIRGKVYTLMGTKTHSTMWKVSYAAQKQVVYFTKAFDIMDQFKRRQLANQQCFSLTHGLQHFITLGHKNGGYQSFLLSSRFEKLHWRETSVIYDDVVAQDDDTGAEHAPKENLDEKAIPAKHESDTVTSSWPELHVVLTLLGRHQTYMRFLTCLTTAAQRYPADVHLHVAIYADPKGEHELSLQATVDNEHLKVTVLIMPGTFSRAAGLTAAAEDLHGNSVLIFMDVDMIFKEQFLYRAASNVVHGNAYFPICYSQYSPETVCYRRPMCRPNPFDFSRDTGTWRVFGKGLFAIRASDYWKAGGFNTSITGWGYEDLEFHSRCVSHSLRILEAPDPGLVHRYHNISCDPALPRMQREMCKNSANSLYGSEAKLTEMAMDVVNIR